MKAPNPNRVKIPLKAIRQAIAAGATKGYIRHHFKVSDSTYYKIKSGQNVKFIISRPNRGKITPGMCTACGINKRTRTFLCAACFKNNTDAECRARV